MINKNWNPLKAIQLGEIAERYVQMTLISYGLEIYPTAVDNRGVDLVVKDHNGKFSEIQVKSVQKADYVYIPKKLMEVEKKLRENYYVFFLHFIQGEEPKLYIFPAAAWENPDGTLLVSKDYGGNLKSKPEYGIKITKKSMEVLKKYEASDEMIEKYFGKMKKGD